MGVWDVYAHIHLNVICHYMTGNSWSREIRCFMLRLDLVDVGY